jgi:hypothetical protein
LFSEIIENIDGVLEAYASAGKYNKEKHPQAIRSLTNRHKKSDPVGSLSFRAGRGTRTPTPFGVRT